MTQILGVIGGSGIGKIDKLVFIKNHEIDTPGVSRQVLF